MSSRQHILDHVALRVSDLSVSRAFYEAALAPLGYRLLSHSSDSLSFGVPGSDDFGLSVGAAATRHAHVAFIARDQTAVQAFYAAALAAGGRDNGAPGFHREYHPTYYAAFVLDPDDNNIEAVFHGR
jgi:catechol 2,3-dioxygenase-like lactoylglutathione lyase family enzyme